MIAFLEVCRGFTFAHRGGAYRCEQHNSLAVKSDRLSWYWHSKGVGGHGIFDFLMKAEGMTFRGALDHLANIDIGAPPNVTAEIKKPKTLVLPEAKGIPLRLYDYLCVQRGIDSGIVERLMQKEQLYEDKRGNVVFVGFDEQGKARFASMRGTWHNHRFRMDCTGSDKRYAFTMAACAPSERLYIFESPIDAMSHASLEKAATGAWERHNRLSLAGTSDTAMPFFLNQHSEVKELVFCLDNDAPGREAAVSMARKYAEKGHRTRLELPQGKDYNEDLLTAITQRKAEKHTLKQHLDVTI
jgi:hypothetical protein